MYGTDIQHGVLVPYSLIYSFLSFFLRPNHPLIVTNKIRRPNPLSFFKKNDFSHSLKGIVAGLAVLAIAVCNLSLFFGFYEEGTIEVSSLSYHEPIL